jgi:catechol 2,3-dioxygenase-like lactoylglutathione lyase family enzyme
VITGLDHVQIAAPPGNEPDARRFYGALLGLPELPKPEGVAGSGGAWFQCGAQQLHIGVQEPFLPAGKAHPAFAVADAATLDVMADRLTSAGASVQWDERIADVRRFFTEDPWGNRLEICVPAGA